MTFGSPRFNKNYQYELIRLCWKNNYEINGGSEKLFKYFLEKYKPKNIISYCDISKFSGDVYEKLGFKLIGYSDPSYIWRSHTTLMTRFDTMRGSLSKKLGLPEEYDNFSESDIMHELGFWKIYDCGNAKYLFERT